MDNKDLFENNKFESVDSDEVKGSDIIESNGIYEDKTEDAQSDSFEGFDKDGFTENKENMGYLFNQPRYDSLMDSAHPKTRGFSVASMVLGIISILTCCSGYISIILAILAIVFSIISRKSLGYFDGMCISGLILGIFGVVFGLSCVIFLLNIIREILEEIPYEDIPGMNGGI